MATAGSSTCLIASLILSISVEIAMNFPFRQGHLPSRPVPGSHHHPLAAVFGRDDLLRASTRESGRMKQPNGNGPHQCKAKMWPVNRQCPEKRSKTAALLSTILTRLFSWREVRKSVFKERILTVQHDLTWLPQLKPSQFAAHLGRLAGSSLVLPRDLVLLAIPEV